MPSIEILSALICEDVRQEVTGRAMLIGVAPVGPSLNAETETIIHRLFFYVEALAGNVSTIHFRLVSEESGHEPMAATISMDDDELAEESNDPDAPTYGVWVFGRQGVKFEKAGFYTLQYSVGDDKWHDVRKFVFPARDEKS